MADMRHRVDVKALKIYQQLFIYIIPIISNLGFINILVVVVRLHWFGKRLKEIGIDQSRSSAGCLRFTDDG